jgi:hypothetical protein
MEHCRLSVGSGSLLLNVEPLVETGDRSGDEDALDKWGSARCRRGVVEAGVKDG